MKWAHQIKSILNQIGMSYIWQNKYKHNDVKFISIKQPFYVS